HLQVLGGPTGDEAFHTVRDCATDVGQRTEVGVVGNQISDVIAKVSRAQAHGVARQSLLETQVVSQTAFGLEIRITEEVEVRKILEHLRKRRRLETGADA